MPFVSKAQARLMYAASEGKSDKVSPKVANDYINASKGMKFKRLKEKIGKKNE